MEDTLGFELRVYMIVDDLRRFISMALQDPVGHEVGGFWQLILSAWVYSDRGVWLYLSEFIDEPTWGERTPP
jgi:hypothetical protein